MNPIVLELDFLPPLTNEKIGRKAYWFQSLRKKYEVILKERLYFVIPKIPYRRARIWYTRFSSKCPDYDGLVDSFKQIQDCLVNIGLIENDSMRHIGKPQYDWVEIPVFEKGKIRIVIEPIIDDKIKL